MLCIDIFIKEYIVCARFLIFFGNIFKILVVVYVATVPEVPYHDLAFSCKMRRKLYFW